MDKIGLYLLMCIDSHKYQKYMTKTFIKLSKTNYPSKYIKPRPSIYNCSFTLLWLAIVRLLLPILTCIIHMPLPIAITISYANNPSHMVQSLIDAKTYFLIYYFHVWWPRSIFHFKWMESFKRNTQFVGVPAI